MNRSGPKRVFACNDACIRPVPDQRVFELAGAIEYPTLQPAFSHSQITSVKPPRFFELGLITGICPEDPVRVEPEYDDDQDYKGNSQPTKPAVCFIRTEVFWRSVVVWLGRFPVSPRRPA